MQYIRHCVESFQRQLVLSRQALDSRQTNDGKISQSIYNVASFRLLVGFYFFLALLRLFLLLVLQSLQIRLNLLFLPHVAVVFQLFQTLNLFLRFRLQLSSELTKRLKLIDELVNHIPQPNVRQNEPARLTSLQNAIKQSAIRFPTLHSLFDRRRRASRVHVTKVKLLVQREENLVVVCLFSR